MNFFFSFIILRCEISKDNDSGGFFVALLTKRAEVGNIDGAGRR
jgi:hypothetical protein